ASGRREGVRDSTATHAPGRGPGTRGGRDRGGDSRSGLRPGRAASPAVASADPWIGAPDLPLRSPDARADGRRRHARRHGRHARESARAAMTPRLALTITVAALTLVVATPAHAQRRDRPTNLGDTQRDLKETQKRLGEARVKAAEARKREAGLLSELEAIDRRLTDRRRQVASLDVRIRKAQSDILVLQGDITRLQGQRTGQEEALGRRLEALYKVQAEGGVLPVLLSGDDPVAQAALVRHLATFATVDARLIREYRVVSEGLAERQDRLQALQTELGGLRTEAETERAQADREASKRLALLARVKDERAYHDRMVGELSEAARRLEAFIVELKEKQRRLAKAAPSTPPRTAPRGFVTGTGFAAWRGGGVWGAGGAGGGGGGGLSFPPVSARGGLEGVWPLQPRG